ncbi:MAG: SDR family NAD(P)-dependent oxidoreductase [Elainellaceae cyanobacterium]
MQTALITGASSGIGRSLAHEMAARSVNLVLVARSDQVLSALADELTQRHGIDAHVIVQDLTEPDAAAAVFSAVEARGLTVNTLINNAGFGEYGPFSDRPRERHLDMIRLNILALVDLTYQFLPGMRSRQRGNIVNIASIAAFQPIPYLSVYAASKSFVLSFSEALWAEVKADGVAVSCVCPGPTDTKFFDEAGFPDSLSGGGMQQTTSPEKVVADIMAILDSKAPVVVSGSFMNQLTANLPRLLPRQMIVSAVEKLFRPPSSSKP